MKYSIKQKFALIFIGLMASTLMVCWVINNAFLQKYYEEEREKALIHTYKLLDKAFTEESVDDESFQIEMEKISGKYNIMGVVQDMNAQIVTTFGNDVEMLKRLSKV